MARRARSGVHDAILAAARAAFARSGLERARVEDIARRAGVSKGAFYLHFDTKEDAFREIVQRFLGAFEDHAVHQREVEARLAQDGVLGSPPEALARQLDAECAMDAELLELLWRNRQILSAVEGASGKRYRDLLADFRRRMRALVARRILERQGAGELRRDVDPAVIADLVVGAYGDFARRMIDMRQKPDLAAWARSLLLVLYQGILRGPAADAPSGRPR